MHVQEVELLVLITGEARRQSESYVEFIIDTNGGEVQLTNIPDNVLHELWHGGFIQITPSEERNGVRPCTLEEALTHLDFRFIVGTVNDKHNRDGIYIGNRLEVFTLKNGKRDIVVLEGTITDVVHGGAPAVPRTRLIRREEVDSLAS